jgi:predicted AlkP superfamily pyrophosphatase or phosphodiesterase
VILVSVDGLRADAIATLGPERLPTLHRLRAEGAWTDNARTDPGFTVTLPNHVAMLTGRPTFGAGGHGWTGNGTPGPNETIHRRKGERVPSVFDAVGDAGLTTALFAGKPKFVLFEQSYGERLAVALIDPDTPVLVDAFLAGFTEQRFAFVLLHLRDPDAAGHSRGFDPEGSAYAEAIALVDGQLGRIVAAIEADPELRAGTVLILTSDHGGNGLGHGNGDHPENYTIPFIVWGTRVVAGDLYALNGDRADAGDERFGAAADPQPIRNGDAANLALSLLGLPPLAGSSFGVADPLTVR